MDKRKLKTRARRLTQWPPVGRARLGSLKRTRPIGPNYGFERGTPVDRYYIDLFLTAHAGDIRGRVLEVGDDAYTRRYGGDGVTHSDVLHVDPAEPQATIVADLTDAPQIPDGSFDCVICAQTLLLIYDVPAAIATLRRILAPGGVLFATIPGIAKINRAEADSWGDFWRFTSDSAQRLFADAFDAAQVSITTYGNVLAATAMLHGLAAEEIGQAKLDDRDPDYEVLIGVRAVASSTEAASSPSRTA